MKWMRFPLFSRLADARSGLLPGALMPGLLLVLSLAPGCDRIYRTDTRPLDQAGMWYRSVEDLRALNITDAEVAELTKVRQAGVTDATCIELIRIARSRKQSFSSGDAVAGLRRAGMSEDSLLELARLNQFGLWVGEAQAMRLMGLSDQVVLAVARRRAAGRAVLSGGAIGQLKNVGLRDGEILALIERGATDAQARGIVAARHRAATPAGFVRQPRMRRR